MARYMNKGIVPVNGAFMQTLSYFLLVYFRNVEKTHDMAINGMETKPSYGW
jgi:hypothetical protein